MKKSVLYGVIAALILMLSVLAYLYYEKPLGSTNTFPELIYRVDSLKKWVDAIGKKYDYLVFQFYTAEHPKDSGWQLLCYGQALKEDYLEYGESPDTLGVHAPGLRADSAVVLGNIMVNPELIRNMIDSALVHDSAGGLANKRLILTPHDTTFTIKNVVHSHYIVYHMSLHKVDQANVLTRIPINKDWFPLNLQKYIKKVNGWNIVEMNPCPPFSMDLGSGYK